MRAVTYTRFGGPEVLSYREVPEPKVGPESVLVEVRAAGVNPVDWQTVAGRLDSRFDVLFPAIPGFDVAGVVTAVGPMVREFRPGDEVLGYVREDVLGRGTFADRVAAPERTLARKPDGLGWVEAAALPVVGLTAYQAVAGLLGVRHGDTVLVQAAAGGVGSVAVQLAHAVGARVLGTASERNHDFVRGLGAEPVAYGPGLFHRLREAAPDGADAILDMFGGDTLRESMSLLRHRPGDRGATRVVSLIDDGVRELGGRFLFAQPSSLDLDALCGLVVRGTVRVPVEVTLPMRAAAEALELSHSGHQRGKIVLVNAQA